MYRPKIILCVAQNRPQRMQTKNLVARAVPSIDNNIFSNIMTDRQTDNTAVDKQKESDTEGEER